MKCRPRMRSGPANEVSNEDLEAIDAAAPARRASASGTSCNARVVRVVPVEERADRLRADRLWPPRRRHQQWPRRLPRRGAGRVVRRRAAPGVRPVWSATSACRGSGDRRTRSTASVWAVTCLFTRAGFRRRGVSRAWRRRRSSSLASAVRARSRPTRSERRSSRRSSTSARARLRRRRLREVSKPTLRRVVMRIDVESGGQQSRRAGRARGPSLRRRAEGRAAGRAGRRHRGRRRRRLRTG